MLLMVLDRLSSVQVSLHSMLSGIGSHTELIEFGLHTSEVVLCLGLLVNCITQLLVKALGLPLKELDIVSASLSLMSQLVSFTYGSSLTRFSLVHLQVLVLKLPS